VFFVLHNALIYVLYVFGHYKTDTSLYYGIAMLANFALFVVANTALIISSGLFRIKRAYICIDTRVHPSSKSGQNEKAEKYSQK